jgi:hypothetical protein
MSHRTSMGSVTATGGSRATGCQSKHLPVMPAQAGIQQGFGETQHSRLRRNDKAVGCDST